LSRPLDFSDRPFPINVYLETQVNSGVYQIDDRLTALSVTQSADNKPSTAEVRIHLGAKDDQPALDPTFITQRFHPDKRIVICEELRPGDRNCLFFGTMTKQDRVINVNDKGGTDNIIVTCGSVISHREQEADGYAYGRYMARERASISSEPAPVESDDIRYVTTSTMQPVFNYRGMPNRSPLTRNVTDFGFTMEIPIFTDELDPRLRGPGAGDPNALFWTYGQALLYCLYWHWIHGHERVTDFDYRSLLEILQDVKDKGVLSTLKLDLQSALRRRCEDLSIAKLNRVEQLVHVAGEAGCHFAAEPNWQGKPSMALTLWAAGSGRIIPGTTDTTEPQKIFLQSAGSTMKDQTSTAVIRQNNISSFHALTDAGVLINRPIVLGGDRRYQIEVELIPGWGKTDLFDDVGFDESESEESETLIKRAIDAIVLPGDEASIEDASEDQKNWYNNYHKNGHFFKDLVDYDLRAVGRLWVLNEHGRYSPEIYGRDLGPYPKEVYEPFEFSTLIQDDRIYPTPWTRRARRLLPSISTDQQGRSLGIVVEVTWDDGQTWETLDDPGMVLILPNQAGIYLDVNNLASIRPSNVEPGDSDKEKTLWGAYIKHQFGLGVTATIEGDEALVSIPQLTGNSISKIERSAVISLPDLRWDNVGGMFTTWGQKKETIDDTPLAEHYAERFQGLNEDWRISSTADIPWIETGYRVGDRISEVEGRGIVFDLLVRGKSRYPEIVSIIHEFGTNHNTKLILESFEAIPGEAVP